MGWKKGEGLGVENNQGIVEPIKIETRAERSGLGSNDAPLSMSANIDAKLQLFKQRRNFHLFLQFPRSY